MVKLKYFEEHLGKTYNKLTVIDIKRHFRYNKPRLFATCQCVCGNITEQCIYAIKRGTVKGCGCQRNTPERNEQNRIHAYKLIEDGRLNRGGDNHPKENREFRVMFNSLKHGNNRKECEITIEELKNVWEKQNGVCPYTKIKLTLPISSSNPNPDICYKMASVDRIDSSKNYTKDNIQFVSRNINYAKSNMSHESMMDFMKLILENNKEPTN